MELNPMCYKILGAIADQKRPSPRAKILYYWMLVYSEEQRSQTITKNLEDVAKDQRCTVRTLKLRLKELIDEKMIVDKNKKKDKTLLVYRLRDFIVHDDAHKTASPNLDTPKVGNGVHQEPKTRVAPTPLFTQYMLTRMKLDKTDVHLQ